MLGTDASRSLRELEEVGALEGLEVDGAGYQGVLSSGSWLRGVNQESGDQHVVINDPTAEGKPQQP